MLKQNLKPFLGKFMKKTSWVAFSDKRTNSEGSSAERLLPTVIPSMSLFDATENLPLVSVTSSPTLPISKASFFRDSGMLRR